MAGTYNTFAAGYREIVFLSKETTYGTIVHPAATDAVQHMKGSFEYSQERVNRLDKTSNRSIRERITHRKEVTWSLELYALPSGSSGTAPDITDGLEYGMGSKVTTTDVLTHASTPCTTTSLVLVAGGTASGGHVVGQAVGWANPAGDLEVSFITVIATDTLTIAPAFSSVPAVGATIKGGVHYKLADVLGTLTITRVLDNFQTVYPGCFVNDLNLTFTGVGEGMITIGGMGQTEYSSGSSALSVAALIGATSMTVTVGDGPKFQPNTRVLINAEGANTEEVVLITAVSGDVITTTRAQAGTSASAHGISAVIGPYEPSRTLAGSPVSGTVGEFVIDGTSSARTTYKMTEASITLNNQGTLRNTEFGTDKASGFFVNKRNVEFTSTLWLEKGQAALYNTAKIFTAQKIMIQLGKTIGSTVAVRMPRAEFMIPKVEAPDDAEVLVPFTGIALGSVALGNDELVISFM